MQIFADLSALSRNRRGPEVEEAQPDGVPEADSASEARNPQEYLYAFLRSRDADAEGLPESFRARLRARARPLRRAATWAHPGDQALRRRAVPDVPGPPPGPRARAGGAGPAAVAAAHTRARCLPPASARSTCAPSTSWSRPPSCATRWSATWPGGCATRCFDAPLIAAERARGQAAGARRAGPAGRHHRPGRPGGPDRRHRRRRPSRSSACSAPRHHAAMLEVMTRRYYRIRHLTDVQVVDRGGRPLLTATYRHDGRDHIVLATTVHTAPAAPVAGEPLAVQARPAPDHRAAAGRLHRAARPLRHRRRGPRRRPGAVRGEDPRVARHAAGTAGPGRRRGPRGPARTSGRPGSRSIPPEHRGADARGDRSPSRTARCAGCTRWWPSGWGCGG